MEPTISPDVQINLSPLERLQREFPNIHISDEAVDFLHKFSKGETDGISCWRHDSVKRKKGSKIHGSGLFSKKEIPEQELIAIKTGRVVDKIVIKENKNIIQGSQQQIGYNEFLTGLTPDEVEKNLIGYNHSCYPNAKVVILQGVPLAFLVTKKPVEKKQEITTDYSVGMMTNTQRIFVCCCGSENCRVIIQPGTDWRNPEFQKQHMDEFPWFTKREIEEMRALTYRGYRMNELYYANKYAADYITLASEQLEQLRQGVVELDRLAPIDSKGIIGKARRKSQLIFDERIKFWTGVMISYADIFCKTTPFNGNLEEIGIDKNNPSFLILKEPPKNPNDEQEMAERAEAQRQLDELVEFTKAFDYNLNP